MSDEREGEKDFTERAAEATDEPRREAGEEGKALEDQADTLVVDEEEGEARPY